MKLRKTEISVKHYSPLNNVLSETHGRLNKHNYVEHEFGAD